MWLLLSPRNSMRYPLNNYYHSKFPLLNKVHIFGKIYKIEDLSISNVQPIVFATLEFVGILCYIDLAFRISNMYVFYTNPFL